MSTLATEALVVGALLAVAMACLAWIAPGSFRTPLRAAGAGLVLGVAFHLGFEATGLNRTYCSTGHACVQK